MRICKKCHTKQNIADFPTAGVVNGKEYRRHVCQICYRKQKNQYKLRKRKQLLKYKESLKCNRCGFNDSRALAFHHIDSSAKNFTIGEALSIGYSIETILEEISKCEVLCFNCHAIEHFVSVV